VLIAEDDQTIATFLVDFLEMHDVQVIGPAADLASLASLLEQGPVDAALLDINLAGEQVFPFADTLVEQGVPFVLTSGYDDSVPARFAMRPRCAKPYRLETLRQALQSVLLPPASGR